MKKGELYEGVVERVDYPNRGVVSDCCPVAGEADGVPRGFPGCNPAPDANTAGEAQKHCAVIVKDTIPGQTVRFSVRKKRKGRAEGHLLEVAGKSPLEMKVPACPHFGLCGGCNYQSLPYGEQLKLKSGQVLNLMRDIVTDADAVFEGILPSPRQFGYRNKMEFTFGDERRDGPLTVGMHRRNSIYDIVTVDRCRIVDADYRNILSATGRYFREAGTPFYHRTRHTGYLRHLLVRKAARTGEILVDLVTAGRDGLRAGAAPGEADPRDSNEDEENLLAGWRRVLLSLDLKGEITGVLHTKNDSFADAVKDGGTEILYGRSYFYEELLGLRFRITPFSFFQTNSPGAEVLYRTVRRFVRESFDAGSGGLNGKTAFDLYSGTGTIAQILAPAVSRVVGVEIAEEAVDAARENAAGNGLENCEFITGDVTVVLDELEERPDLIILDPPREGIHPKALGKIIRYGVKRMIYISCKPTSLCRDLVVLGENGYVVKRMCCVDMFPGTVHTETVVLLGRAGEN